MFKQGIVALTVYVSFLICSPPPSYGPYDMTLTGFDVCQGPKAKNCTILSGNVTDKSSIYMNLVVTKKCSPSKGKIRTYANGKEVARFQMNKPCEHLFLRPLLTALFNVTKRGCYILEGDYSRKVDMEQIMVNYFGGSFFYGNISFRSHLYSDVCNFSCTILSITLTPK